MLWKSVELIDIAMGFLDATECRISSFGSLKLADAIG